jgi:hypothetical protein
VASGGRHLRSCEKLPLNVRTIPRILKWPDKSSLPPMNACDLGVAATANSVLRLYFPSPSQRIAKACHKQCQHQGRPRCFQSPSCRLITCRDKRHIRDGAADASVEHAGVGRTIIEAVVVELYRTSTASGDISERLRRGIIDAAKLGCVVTERRWEAVRVE